VISPYFIAFAMVLQIGGYVIYARSTWRGEAEPDLVSWSLWMVIPFLAFATEMQQGVGIESMVTFLGGAGPLLVVMVALFSNRPQWELHTFDWVCGSIAVLGVVLWLASRNPLLGLCAFLVAQASAGLPTIFKAWHEPTTENVWTWMADVVTSGIALFIVTNVSIATVGFALEEMIFAGIVTVLVLWKIGPRLRGEAHVKGNEHAHLTHREWLHTHALTTHFHPELRPHLPRHRPRYFEHTRRKALGFDAAEPDQIGPDEEPLPSV